MHQTALLCPVASPRPRRFWLAVLLSFSLHALFALALWTLPTRYPGPANDAPLAEIPVIVVSAEELTISHAAEPPSPVAPTSALEQNPGPIVVQALAFNASKQAAGEADVPRVRGAVPNGGMAPGTVANAGEPSGRVFFGVSVQARSVVFLIDRSISMGLNDGLDAAKRELLANLARLPATTRFQVYFYNNDVECVGSAEPDHLLANTNEARQRVFELV